MEAGRSSGAYIVGNSDPGTLTITSGTFNVNDTHETSLAIYNLGTMTMTGGTITSKGAGICTASSQWTSSSYHAQSTISNITISASYRVLITGNTNGSTVMKGSATLTNCTINSGKIETLHSSHLSIYYGSVATGVTYSSGDNGVVGRVTKDTSGYDVYVYGPSSSQTVKLPTWTTANGQDDMVWYTASYITNAGDNCWHYRVNKSNFKNSNGPYRSDIYVTINGTDTRQFALTNISL